MQISRKVGARDWAGRRPKARMRVFGACGFKCQDIASSLFRISRPEIGPSGARAAQMWASLVLRFRILAMKNTTKRRMGGSPAIMQLCMPRRRQHTNLQTRSTQGAHRNVCSLRSDKCPRIWPTYLAGEQRKHARFAASVLQVRPLGRWPKPNELYQEHSAGAYASFFRVNLSQGENGQPIGIKKATG